MDIDALTDADRKALAKHLAAELDTGLYGNRAVLSRRQLLSIAGGSAGVAGLVALGIDPATAQSAAGQVGTESSPENVFAFDLDVQGALQRDLDAGGQAIENAGSVSTGELGIANSDIYVYSGGGDFVTTVDPSITNPVTTAVNEAQSAPPGGGLVKLPVGTITQSEELPNMRNVTVSGYGRNSTFLEFTHTGTDAHAAHLGEASLEDDHGALTDMRIVGPGNAETTGAAVLFSGQVRDFELDNVLIINWGAPGIQSDAKPFEMDWGHVHIQNCSGSAVVLFNDLGPTNSWRVAKINGDGTTDQLAYRHSGGGEMNIEVANLNGDIDGDTSLSNCAVLLNSPNGGTTIHRTNFETDTTNADVLFDVRERGQNRITDVWHHNNTLEHIYHIDNPALEHGYFTRAKIGGTLNSTQINVAVAPSEKVLYEGTSDDVTNNTGTQNIRCLGDGTDA